MDIFSTILGVIKVADTIKKLIEDVKESSAELKALNAEIVTMREVISLCSDIFGPNEELKSKFSFLAQTAESTLKDLMATIQPYQQAVRRDNTLSRWKLLRKYLDKDKIAQHKQSLHSITSRMNLFFSMHNYQELTVGAGKAIKNAAINGRDPAASSGDFNRGLKFDRGKNDKESGLPTYRSYDVHTFLARLDIQDRDQNCGRIPEANVATCNWIFRSPPYLAWRASDESSRFYLSGQMDVARVHQFLSRRPGLFEEVKSQTDVLDGYNLEQERAHINLSLSTLWVILMTALNASRHLEIYCFIDALDECDLGSVTELAKLYTMSIRNDFSLDKKIKFFISSRLGPAEIQIPQLLRTTPRVHHLEVRPELVAPDIKVVVQDSLSEMDALELTKSQRDEIQSLLTAKTEGMFIWVRTALTMIENSADIMPFVGIVSLINHMPPEMNELYFQAMLRLHKSLDSGKESLKLVRRVLGWINFNALNDDGQRIVDDDTKDNMKTRLEDYALLGYASQSWSIHLLHCPEHSEDACELALELLFKHRCVLECAEQIRQFLEDSTRQRYWAILEPLHHAVYIDALVLSRRILSRGDVQINKMDEAGA
ncbi:hypothetical protein QBC38DRAFT_443829 [Podospora fimiseda]|uniref:Nephrocystin 3-like N-terminal domain-containing protein n=1 Tax=Podospora fimiseda TaxID=252190 RepID=A0AAN7BPV4_9PEZI|nr:hypothetical protein QBC38DRAFT_443829 [Podospora fimiseda]